MLTEIYIFFVFILSSFLQTVTGFGYAIITAPLLALALGAKETVMLVMMTGFIISLFLLRATKNEGSFKAISVLLIAGIIGAIPGAYVLTLISGDALKIFIGVVLLIATIAMWQNCTFNVQYHTLVETLVGAFAGFLATTTSINGPPVVLYYLNSKAEENRSVFRANLARYFILMSLASIAISYFAGNLNIRELWLHVVLSIPALYIGFYLGEYFFHRIDQASFRKASLLMVSLSSMAIIWKGFAKFL